MDKFLLAENPMRPDQSGLWIIHMLSPFSIIACTEDRVERGNIFKHFTFVNSEGITEDWTLSIYHASGEGTTEEVSAKALKLLDRAWRWYRSYMEWEDGNIDEGGKVELN